jgi:hypothetical protein
MSDFNRAESAKWAHENQKLVGDLHAAADKALAEAAGRGFTAAPGVTLATILAGGQEVKDKLTEANGKIYDDRRKVIFEQDEFAMKIVVQLAKLGMELYRDELLNTLAIEQAENMALRDQGTADVIRMNAEVDARQVAIIRDRAEIEARIAVYKQQLVDAEALTLVSERALITAQLATAEKKLEIIDSIYKVLAAEELVLEAENRRAATLEVLLAAQMIVAEIKEAMIPFYIEKAEARVELAEAIEKEIPIKKAIEELGYDRITLTNQKEYAAHLLRVADGELELARLGWTRANSVMEVFRLEARRLLQEYENTVQTEVLALKESLAEDGIDLRLETNLARTKIGIDDDVEIQNAEIVNTGTELTALLAGLAARAHSQADAILSSMRTSSSSWATNNLKRMISG